MCTSKKNGLNRRRSYHMCAANSEAQLLIRKH